METITIKNIDMYYQKRKDRANFYYMQLHVKCLGDYPFCNLSPQQKWLFAGLTMLQLRENKQTPYDVGYISHELRYPKEDISSDINKLREVGMITLTNDGQMPTDADSLIYKENDKDKENDKEISSQIEDLLRRFPIEQQLIINKYIDMIREKNKTKKVTNGRKVTLLLELLNSKERANDDVLFKTALDGCIKYNAPNIGYINAIIKNRKMAC
jgi:hypothetical protein